jgi:hypothetical protein
MAVKNDFICPPDPHGQVHTQLSNPDRSLPAHAAAKSKNSPEWVLFVNRISKAQSSFLIRS